MEIKNPKRIHINKPDEENREAPIPAPDIFKPKPREAPEAPIPAPEIFQPREAPVEVPVEVPAGR